MKLLALLFAILAAVPQALKWMAFGFGKMGGCTLPAQSGCEIGGNDQAELLMKIWGPNWFTTTGLWIGLAGFAAAMVIAKVLEKISDAKSRRTMDRADRQSGIGRSMGQGGPGQPRTDAYGRMPRPPAFDRHGRPRQ